MAFSRYTLLFMLLVLFGPATSFASLIESATFEPSSGKMDFLGVESARMMDRGAFDFSILSDIATNSLTRYDSASNPVEEWELASRDRIWNLHLGASIGISRWLTANVHASGQPLTLIDQNSNLVYKPTHALQKANASLKVNLITKRFFALSIMSKSGVYFNDHNPYWGADDSDGRQSALPFAEGHFLISVGNKLQLALQAGYGWRQLAETSLTTLGTDFLASDGYYIAKAGIGYGDELRVFLEGFTYIPRAASAWDVERSTSTAEAMLGLRKRWGSRSHAFAAIGSELFHGIGSADYRAVFGYQWNLHKPRSSGDAAPEELETTTALEPAPQPSAKKARPPNPLIDQPDYRVVLTNIRFASGSAELRLQDELTDNELQRSLAIIQEKKPRLIVLEGHTDSVGSAYSNQALSKMRAESVRTYLLQNGALVAGKSTVRLVSYGYGESKPISPNTTSEGRAKNRRVELLFYP